VNQPRRDLESEKALLGVLLIKPELIPHINEIIKTKEYFYNTQNKYIWDLIREMIDKELPLDDFSINNEIKKGKYKDKIDFDYISKLVTIVPSTEHWKYYTEQVVDCWRARELEKKCLIATNQLQKLEDTRKVWIELVDKLPAIFSQEERDDYTVHDLMQKIADAEAGKVKLGYSWGLEALDRRLGNMQPGTIHVIAGRPGHCKTSLALQIADALTKEGTRVLYESLEMSKAAIDMRRLSRLSGISLYDLKNGRVSDRWDKLNTTGEELFNKQKYFLVKDKKYKTADDIALDIKIAHDLYGIEVFILDHWHRVIMPMQGHDNYLHRAESSFEKIISTCTNKKITPIIVAQLSRESARRATQESLPILTDIRELGRIEEAADTVIFTHWGYKFTKREDKESRDNLVIRIAKARDGGEDDIRIDFDYRTLTFRGEL
jgi:replicative DNA helicase